MSVPKIVLGLLERLLAFFERRRGLSIVVIAAIFLVLGTTSAVIRRPPLLSPAVDGLAGFFFSAFSPPLRLVGFFSKSTSSSSRIMRLELELASLRRAERENVRFRAILGYKSPPAYQVVPGRVIGLDLDPLRGIAWISLGTGSGLSGGEAVLTVDGLVGVVDKLWGGRSRVRLLRNEYTPVSVRNTRSRDLGVVEWDPGTGRMRVSQIPFQADVALGDTLVSSGLGGVFPPDLPVGVVAAIADPPEQLLKDVVLEPFGVFFQLEEIFVLVPESGPVFSIPPEELDAPEPRAPGIENLDSPDDSAGVGDRR